MNKLIAAFGSWYYVIKANTLLRATNDCFTSRINSRQEETKSRQKKFILTIILFLAHRRSNHSCLVQDQLNII